MSYFTTSVIEWYRVNKRELPWRETSDPYKIWISEIMLQQTRVAQGLGYYLRFIEAFPTVTALANASLDYVLKQWQGLGYYSRARNLHETAKRIVDEFYGVIPGTYAELIKLKGIGDYTASAICAFAFKQRIAAVDGNVYRILSRFYGIDTPIDTTLGKKELHAIAQEMVDATHPDLYNQAIMDFGALMCSPSNPSCSFCPLMLQCQAFRDGTVSLLPAKSKKIKVKDRYFTYLIFLEGGYTFIRKREEKDIWHSLYDFPLIESNRDLTYNELLATKEWAALVGTEDLHILNVSSLIKHPLSHQNLYTRFYTIRLEDASTNLLEGYMRVLADDVASYSTPRLIDSFLAAEPLAKYVVGKKNR